MLINRDCLEYLKDMDSNSVDLFCSDVPYKIVSGGVSKDPKAPTGMLSNTNSVVRSGKLFKHNDIDFNEWLPDIFRVLKDKSHCYIMINSRNLAKLQIESEKVGFIFQNLLVWDKGNATPNKYYMQSAEFILMLRKGGAKNINNLGTKTVLRVPNVRNKQHPTQKPTNLMNILIENSTNKGDTVLDPFMGSGSCGVACVNLDREFIGIELDSEYFKIAENRINQAKKDKEASLF